MKNIDIFLISAQNIDCRYSLEPPRRGGSNEYPHSMFLSRIEAGSNEYLQSMFWAEIRKMVLTSTHNLCFWAEIRKIMYTPVNSSFTI